MLISELRSYADQYKQCQTSRTRVAENTPKQSVKEKVKRMKYRLFQGTVTTLLLLFAVYPASAAHKVVNDDQKPLMAVQLTDSKGNPTARLYIVPKEEMVFGDDGWPVSGAGYIEAIEGRT